jgi:S-adenosylmethionine:tRNA ribosyltransferase-isomerase
MVSGQLLTSHFDYDLPEELIAQRPAHRRDASRLMVVDRASGSITHTQFNHLPEYVHAGDYLVFNRSRVIRARLRLVRPSGATAEALLLREVESGTWLALVRPSRKLAPGARVRLADSDIWITIGQYAEGGQRVVTFDGNVDVLDVLERYGEVPLPPYIRDRSSPDERYQTVYADRSGSVAAPTAGLHFTPELLERLRTEGALCGFVTLHVGAGTFKPVTVEEVERHVMHAEWGDVPTEVAAGVNAARAEGHRTVAVGTTSTRLLESAATSEGLQAWTGDTNLFIVPGYRFKCVDAMVTNFHLPRSTLLMLVSAFAGRELIRRAYDEAVRLRYRFFSFGDAMLIL